MLFGYRGSTGRLRFLDACTGERHRLVGARGAEIVLAFLEPRSVASAQGDGFSEQEIEQAQRAGLIVAEEDCERLALWEHAGWSRPAYLMFSQMDLDYVESADGDDHAAPDAHGRSALRELRRGQVQRYGIEAPYPLPRPLAGGAAVALPAARGIEPRLSGLTARRSVRAFSPDAPDAGQLADLLYASTASLRSVASDRAGGDPFRLLNSMYSWAHLFVVVQKVEGLPEGVFEYDWSEHRLLTSRERFEPDDLSATVQHQQWVLGPGFAIFVVADLRSYAWLYRHSRAYMHVLIQLGELGQEILTDATTLGLGGWTTPAVHESRAASLLGLPDADGVEVLWMTKLGSPLRRQARDGAVRALDALPAGAPG